jgi:RimJ/RimL family protein N-acetyltransferase
MTNRNVVAAGPRIALAKMTEADQHFFWEWMQNPEVLRMVDNTTAPSIEDQHRWFARTQQPDRRMFSILTLPDEELIGHCGYVDIDQEKKDAQLRITIGNPEEWGKGYGTEVVKLLLHYAKEEMKLSQVWLQVRKDNDRAKRLYEGVGFRVNESTITSADLLRMEHSLSLDLLH